MDPKLCKSGVFCTAAQFEKQQFRMEGITKIEVSNEIKCIEINKKAWAFWGGCAATDVNNNIH